MGKSCPGQQGYYPSRVNFSERLYEPFPEPRACRTCSDRLALNELTRLGQPKCLYGGKVGSAKRVTFLVEPTFCFSCKWLVKFSNEM